MRAVCPSHRIFDIITLIIYLYNKQCWLVGELLLLRDFDLYVIILMMCVFITVSMVSRSFAVRVILVLWDNIMTVATVILLRETSYIIHALLYNAAQLL
jgi:hypothetical protein